MQAPNAQLAQSTYTGDLLFRTYQAAVAAQLALTDGDFDRALGFFRKLAHRISSLDECIVSAWHATLARAAVEALPRRSGARRNELLAEAEQQVKRCLRRSKRFAFYHMQALREEALLLILRGQEQAGQAALNYALQQTLEYRMPYQQLLTHREWLRCARELDWPGVAWHEQECVRLCAQMKTPWLLPARCELLPDLHDLATHAAAALSGQSESAPPTGKLLGRAPEWSSFWQSLIEQAGRRTDQRQELLRARQRLEHSARWLEQLEQSPLLRIQQVGEESQTTVCLHDLIWSFQIQAPFPRSAQALHVSERLEIQGRLLTVEPTDTVAAEIQAVLGHLSPSPEGILRAFRATGLLVQAQGEPPPWLSENESSVLAGVLRELLSNAARHAPRQPAHIVWRSQPQQMEMEVVNPVANVHQSPTGSGRGLDYVRWRLAEIGASFDFQRRECTASALVRLQRAQFVP